MSQVYLAEHRGSTNCGDRKSNQHKSIQIKCWFLVRGKTGVPGGKPLGAEQRIKKPKYDVRSGNRTRATLVEGHCSHHCSNTVPQGLTINNIVAFTIIIHNKQYCCINSRCHCFYLCQVQRPFQEKHSELGSKAFQHNGYHRELAHSSKSLDLS